MSLPRFRELPDWAADRLTTDVTVHLSRWDRLRLLVQGSMLLRVNVTCEHPPGRVESESGVELPHRCWPWHRHMSIGYVETATPEPPS
jgi:hypothetical protein